MNWTLGLALYFLIWWVTLFAVLPFGVRSQEESGAVAPGTGPGAPDIAALGRPLVIGFSRKRTLAHLLGDPRGTVGTTEASVGIAVAAYERGATILRAHDVRAHVEALAAARAVYA